MRNFKCVTWPQSSDAVARVYCLELMQRLGTFLRQLQASDQTCKSISGLNGVGGEILGFGVSCECLRAMSAAVQANGDRKAFNEVLRYAIHLMNFLH